MVEIISIAVTIAIAAIAGGFGLWNAMGGKIEKVEEDLNKRIDKMESMQGTFVNKDDHNASLSRMERALESVGLVIREGNDTLTKRMDSVLFEIGRRDKNGANS